jgi:hypothetical protein
MRLLLTSLLWPLLCLHTSSPDCIVFNTRGDRSKLELGEPGGALYPVWSTTPKDLSAFGLGVAMYVQIIFSVSIGKSGAAVIIVESDR